MKGKCAGHTHRSEKVGLPLLIERRTWPPTHMFEIPIDIPLLKKILSLVYKLKYKRCIITSETSVGL
jgi:hypothetical protein